MTVSRERFRTSSEGHSQAARFIAVMASDWREVTFNQWIRDEQEPEHRSLNHSVVRGDGTGNSELIASVADIILEVIRSHEPFLYLGLGAKFDSGDEEFLFRAKQVDGDGHLSSPDDSSVVVVVSSHEAD